jgi:hypothetical protein
MGYPHCLCFGMPRICERLLALSCEPPIIEISFERAVHVEIILRMRACAPNRRTEQAHRTGAPNRRTEQAQRTGATNGRNEQAQRTGAPNRRNEQAQRTGATNKRRGRKPPTCISTVVITSDRYCGIYHFLLTVTYTGLHVYTVG